MIVEHNHCLWPFCLGELRQNGPDTSIEVEPTSHTVTQLELVYLLDALNGGRYSNGMICIFLRFCSSSHNRLELRHYGKI